MFNWLKSGYKRASATTAPISYEDLEGRPFDVVENIMRSAAKTPGAFAVDSAQALSRRLIEIAWFDEGVDMAVRKRAVVMEEVTWKSIEDALRSHPDALNARRDARNTHLEHGRSTGVFRLMHKVRKVAPDRVISEIVSLRNAHLLPDLPREPLQGQRDQVLRELICDRASMQISQEWIKGDSTAVSTLTTTNAVIAAGWLVLIRDPTALWVLTDAERIELGKYLDDYDRARSRLIAVGVLQPDQGASLLPPPEPRALHDLILTTARDGTLGKGAGTTGRHHLRLRSLTDATRRNFMAVVLGLRLFIWKRTLTSIYGTSFAGQVFTADPNSQWAQSAQPFLTKLENLYDLALSRDPRAAGLQENEDNWGFHNLIVASETMEFVDPSLMESDKTRLLQGFSEIFSTELFHFPQYARYLLRFAIHGEAVVDAAMTEDAVLQLSRK